MEFYFDPFFWALVSMFGMTMAVGAWGRPDKVGKFPVDIAYGGLFYAIVDAQHLGVRVEPKNCSKLIHIGNKIIDAVNLIMKVEHPEIAEINKLFLAQIYDKPQHPEADAKNVVVTKGGQNDRSPCGTGTSARMATLYAKGDLELNEEFVNESINKLGLVPQGF